MSTLPDSNGSSPSPLTLEMSPTAGKLFAALAKAQGEMISAKKTAKAKARGDRDYRYATLDDVLDALREVLARHEITRFQTTEPAGRDGVCVVTWLGHSSGEWIRGRLFMPIPDRVDKEGNVYPPDTQDFGRALTYARRYALSAITGIATEEDDDAQGARQGERAAPRQAPATRKGPTRDEMIAEAVTYFGPRFAQAKTEEELTRLKSMFSDAVGGKAPAETMAWLLEQEKQARAALGLPPPGPRLVQARAPAPPAAPANGMSADEEEHRRVLEPLFRTCDTETKFRSISRRALTAGNYDQASRAYQEWYYTERTAAAARLGISIGPKTAGGAS